VAGQEHAEGREWREFEAALSIGRQKSTPTDVERQITHGDYKIDNLVRHLSSPAVP
jgi:hypothetical protein